MLPERVLPWVWRWADPAGTDRAGTALSTPDGVVVKIGRAHV
jgi:hypothetical protein